MRARGIALFMSALMVILTACGIDTKTPTPSSSTSASASAATDYKQCSSEHPKTLKDFLNQSSTGTVVYADLWDENGDAGDRGLFERKLDNKTWVVAADAQFSRTKTGDCVVRIMIQSARHKTFQVVDLGGTMPSTDHDMHVKRDELSVVPGPNLDLSPIRFETPHNSKAPNA